MGTRQRVIALELAESAFLWTWILASLVAVYAVVAVFAFGGRWRTVLIAFAVGAIGKWLGRAFGELRRDESMKLVTRVSTIE